MNGLLAVSVSWIKVLGWSILVPLTASALPLSVVVTLFSLPMTRTLSLSPAGLPLGLG